MSMRKTIYIPTNLSEKIEKNPEINISLICRDALAKVLDNPEETKEALLVADISSVKNELRSLKEAVEGIARKAASQAGMVVLSAEEAKLFREITGDTATINAFVMKTKREAVEEYKQKINEKRQETLLKNREQKNLESTCMVCGDPEDVPCVTCGAPLCWLCWTGEDPSNATQRCPECIDAGHVI